MTFAKAMERMERLTSVAQVPVSQTAVQKTGNEGRTVEQCRNNDACDQTWRSSFCGKAYAGESDIREADGSLPSLLSLSRGPEEFLRYLRALWKV